MNSSTSSFRHELGVVACVILAVVLLEAVMRGLENSFSKDIAHIRSGEDVAERLDAATGSKVLLLGNSLTRDGIEPEYLARAIGPDSRVEAYYPDGSSVGEWAYAYRKLFMHPGTNPDLLIVGAGRSHLFDSELRSERFGAYFCDWQDLPRYFSRHIRDPDDAACFFLARFSVAYANRERVQPRVFSSLIPHYQSILPRLATKSSPPADVAQRTTRHRNLEELLSDAQASGARVVVLAIPMPESYPLPEETQRLIDASGAVLIDARNLEGIGPDNFPDNYHLDPEGAKILTKHLVDQLELVWPHDEIDASRSRE